MTREELLATAGQKYDEVPVLVLASAIDYATEKHAGQKRKSGEPYINHPLAVAEILIEWGMDIDTVVAGVLHDTVEDTDATLDELESFTGTRRHAQPGQLFAAHQGQFDQADDRGGRRCTGDYH